MKKKNSKKIIVLLSLIIVILVLFIVGISMQAKTINITGNEQYTDEEIKDFIFDKAYEKNILVLWAKNKLGITESIPFVEKYDVEIDSISEVTVTIYEKRVVGYIDYMGNFMYFDKDGMVVESSTKKIENIPRVTGIDFDYILLHEVLPVKDTEVFDLILMVTQAMSKYDLDVEKIYVSETMEITLYKGNVKIFLGTDKDLSEKISDFSELAPKLEGHSGTLDMSVLDKEGDGYTLKKDVK